MMWRVLSYRTKPGDAHGLLTAWSGWEQIAHYLWPTTDIPSAPFRLLELRLGSWSHEFVALSDGTIIEEGDLIAELHCNNQNILTLVGDRGGNPFAAAREDLRSLAAWADQDEIGRKIRALFGVTMLTRAASRLGFTVRAERPNIRRRFEYVYMTGLLLLYAADGMRRLTNGATPRTYPQEVWMSRRELIRRYGRRPRPSLPTADDRQSASLES